MERSVITQYGHEEIDWEREIVLEVPDNFDPETLDDERLEELADEADIEWEMDCSDGIIANKHAVHQAGQAHGREQMLVLKWKENDNNYKKGAEIWTTTN